MGEATKDAGATVRVVGRYALYGSIASGGMATVHLGRLLGPVGFSRTVAIKRLHAQFAQDPEFVSMFLDEARLAARIRHPNVVQTIDVVATAGELFLVMEYVPGDSLSRLLRVARDRRQRVPHRVVSAIVSSLLHGLHAAHEAKSERGAPLGIVHRDVSPQNVLVGTDGVARVLDFGVAKAAGRTQETRDGQIKGKLSYMAPEQLRGLEVNRQSDIYAAGVVLWELLTGERLYVADNEGALLAKVLEGRVFPPSRYLVDASGRTANQSDFTLLQQLDEVTLRALAPDPAARYPTAREMAVALERCLPPATQFEVGEWVESVAADVLGQRATLVAEIESSASMSLPKEAIAAAMGSGFSPGIDAGAFPSSMPPPPPPPPSASLPALPPTPGDSQLSSISVAGPPRGRPQTAAPRTAAAVLIAIAGTLIAVLLVAGVFVLRKGKTSAATTTTATSAATPPQPSTVPSALAPDPSADVTPTPSTTSTAPAGTGSAATSATKPTKVRPTRPTPGPGPSAAPPPTDCVYWDNGIKHVNPKCM